MESGQPVQYGEQETVRTQPIGEALVSLKQGSLHRSARGVFGGIVASNMLLQLFELSPNLEELWLSFAVPSDARPQETRMEVATSGTFYYTGTDDEVSTWPRESRLQIPALMRTIATCPLTRLELDFAHFGTATRHVLEGLRLNMPQLHHLERFSIANEANATEAEWLDWDVRPLQLQELRVVASQHLSLAALRTLLEGSSSTLERLCVSDSVGRSLGPNPRQAPMACMDELSASRARWAAQHGQTLGGHVAQMWSGIQQKCYRRSCVRIA